MTDYGAPSWDPTLFAGSARFYSRGRVAYLLNEASNGRAFSERMSPVVLDIWRPWSPNGYAAGDRGLVWFAFTAGWGLACPGGGPTPSDQTVVTEGGGESHP